MNRYGRPKTKAGYTATLLFVDRLSKKVHFAPCWNDVGAQEFAQMFPHDIFSKHGLSLGIVSGEVLNQIPTFEKLKPKLLGAKQCLLELHCSRTLSHAQASKLSLKVLLKLP